VLLLVVLLYKIFSMGLRGSVGFLVERTLGRARKTGIWPAIVGSLYVHGPDALIAIPLGVSAAIYLEESHAARTGSRTLSRLISRTSPAFLPSFTGLLGLALFNRWMHLGASVWTGA